MGVKHTFKFINISDSYTAEDYVYLKIQKVKDKLSVLDNILAFASYNMILKNKRGLELDFLPHFLHDF